LDALSDQAYHRIRQMVLEQAFPKDKRISETRLGCELGISRTPVREAIQRLAQEGLLVQRPSSGTYVVEPKSHDVHDIYEVRLALESMAAAKATKRIKPRDIRQLKQHVEDMNRVIHTFRQTGLPVLKDELLLQFHMADKAFHDLILKAAGNSFARSIVSQGHVKQYVFGLDSHHRDLHHLSWVWLMHARIARAIAQRDARAARHWMAKHIRSSMKDALEQVR
jgi:DNA-binding GntR family transcriptional regulator